jgi:hypothetical protein
MADSPANENVLTFSLRQDFYSVHEGDCYLKSQGFKRKGVIWEKGEMRAHVCQRRIQGADDGQRVTRRAWISYWRQSTRNENLKKSTKQDRGY